VFVLSPGSVARYSLFVLKMLNKPTPTNQPTNQPTMNLLKMGVCLTLQCALLPEKYHKWGWFGLVKVNDNAD